MPFRENAIVDVLPSVLKELFLEVGDKFVWDRAEEGVYYLEVIERCYEGGESIARCKVLERMA